MGRNTSDNEPISTAPAAGCEEHRAIGTVGNALNYYEGGRRIVRFGEPRRPRRNDSAEPKPTVPSSDALRASGPFEQSLHWDAPKLPVIRNVFPRLSRPCRSAILVVTCYGVRAYVNRGPLPGRCEVEEPIVPMVNNSARRQRSNKRNARYGGTPLGSYLPLCTPNPLYDTTHSPTNHCHKSFVGNALRRTRNS